VNSHHKDLFAWRVPRAAKVTRAAEVARTMKVMRAKKDSRGSEVVKAVEGGKTLGADTERELTIPRT
jgi:hypothetical protein